MRLFKEEKEFVESEVTRLVNNFLDEHKLEEETLATIKQSELFKKAVSMAKSLGIGSEPEIDLYDNRIRLCFSEGERYIDLRFPINLTRTYCKTYYYVTQSDKYYPSSEALAELNKMCLATKTPTEETRFVTLETISKNFANQQIAEITNIYSQNLKILKELK